MVHDKQDSPVAGQGGEDFPQAGLVVGQCLVEELLSRPIQGHGVVTGFPDVQTGEYVYVLLIQNHRHTAPMSVRHKHVLAGQRRQVSAYTLRRIGRRASISDQLPPDRSR
jgi:hypothetical protein